MSFKYNPIQPCLFFLNCHKLNTPRLSPQPQVSNPSAQTAEEGRMESSRDTNTNKHMSGQRMGLWLFGCAGRLSERKCLRGPLVHGGEQSTGNSEIICLQQLLPWEHVYYHERSPPTPRFRCLIVWWPTPLPPDPCQRWQRWSWPWDPRGSCSDWHLSHWSELPVSAPSFQDPVDAACMSTSRPQIPG